MSHGDVDLDRLRLIFDEVIEIAADARTAYLDQRCRDDSALRAELERMLACPTADSPTADELHDSSAPAPDGMLGERIDRYLLVERIGEGGHGVVYCAEQEEPIRRRVAVKIIKPGMDTRQVIARFEAERQTLALMDHPNIAKVLDAGQTEQGLPYFVMELVEGARITDFCDRKKLALEKRLALFQSVCLAVQHAHQKGIIHRDIKPSNLLVALHDNEPLVKVIDFGIAKAVERRPEERTMYSESGQFIGTPEYMSPEQADGNPADIDTRSDVYSLGVVLYELVTGRTPIDRTALHSAGFTEMLRLIRETEPRRPSTLLTTMTDAERARVADACRVDARRISRVVRGDLDWIILKALEKDRGRRCVSPAVLAENIRCFLRHEPVSVRRPSTVYILFKFVRRHRMGVAFTSLVAIALIAGLGLVFAMEQWRIEGARQAETARAEAVQSVLLDLVEALSPWVNGTDPDPIKVVEVLNRTVADAVEADFPTRVRLMRATSQLYWRLGHQRQAAELLEHVLSEARDELGRTHPTTLGLALGVADFRYHVGDFEAVQEICDQYLEPQNEPATRSHVELEVRRGIALSMMGKHSEAIAVLEQLVSADGKPNDMHTLRHQEYLGEALMEAGRPGEAEPILRELVEAGDPLIRSIDYVLFDANAEEVTIDIGGGKRVCDKGLWTTEWVDAHARSLLALGRTGEAELLFGEAFRVRRAWLGEDNPETLRSMRGLALARFANEDAKAVAQLEKVVELSLGRGPATNPLYLATHRLALGGCLLRAGRADDAIPVLMLASSELARMCGANGAGAQRAAELLEEARNAIPAPPEPD